MSATDLCSCKRPTGEPGENCTVCGALIPKPGEVLPEQMRVPPEEMQVQKTRKTLTVYVCPTPHCPSVTAVTDPNERLEREWTGPKVEDKGKLEMDTGSRYRHNRAECPLCRVKGNPVQRIRMQVPVDVPAVGPPTPPLPGPTGRYHDRQPVRQPEG